MALAFIGATIYEILEQEVEKYLDDVLTPLGDNFATFEVAFLTFVAQQHHSLQLKGRKVRSMLQYMHRHFIKEPHNIWIRKPLMEELYTIRLNARFGDQARKSTIKLILNVGPCLPMMPKPVIRGIIIGPLIGKASQIQRITSAQRRVYLLATRLDRCASISESKNEPWEEGPEIFLAWWRNSFMAKFYHWSLFIRSDDLPKGRSILCQLTVSDGIVGFDATENPTLIQGALENGRCIGLTMCSNDEIKNQGKYPA